MFVLPLTDPLWHKLDDAHRDRDIPKILGDLSQEWDEAVANSLFWDCLCHQDTCYGATYAAVPHLLDISKHTSTQGAESIAHFLGHVSVVAFETGGCCGEEDREIPQGLARTTQAWDRKLDTVRSLAEYARQDLKDPDFPRPLPSESEQLGLLSAEVKDALSALAAEMKIDDSDQPEIPLTYTREHRRAELERREDLLARDPVNEADLQIIAKIRDAFFQAQDAIFELCMQSYKDTQDPSSRGYFLSGAAAAKGDRHLAQFLSYGDEGCFGCGHCRCVYDFVMYDQRMACYAPQDDMDEADLRVRWKSPMLLDHRDGAPNRADGFVQPCTDLEPGSPAQNVLALAQAQNDPGNETRVRLFKGSYHCTNCDTLTQLAQPQY
ncbi:MAG: hypothetical protein ABJ251_10985 [Paracoccaceae bacterium]